MSALIKGIKIPTDDILTIRIYPDGMVERVDERIVIKKDRLGLPQIVNRSSFEHIGEAVEVPTPHGRLIDADELENICVDLNNREEEEWEITRGDYKRMDCVLFEFPTVIEREE